MTWKCNFRVSFQRLLTLIHRLRWHFKVPGTDWPRHYRTNLFKQLIVRQRRLQHTFCGRYEQTVNDVYSRLHGGSPPKESVLERERTSRKEKYAKEQKEGNSMLRSFSLHCCLSVCWVCQRSGGMLWLEVNNLSRPWMTHTGTTLTDSHKSMWWKHFMNKS